MATKNEFDPDNPIHTWLCGVAVTAVTLLPDVAALVGPQHALEAFSEACLNDADRMGISITHTDMSEEVARSLRAAYLRLVES